MNGAALQDRTPQPGEEGSPQCVAVLLALRENGGVATAEVLRRKTRLHPSTLADVLMGLNDRRRAWFDASWGGIGAWRLGARR